MEIPKYDYVHIFNTTEKFPWSLHSKESGIVTTFLDMSHSFEVESGYSLPSLVFNAQ